MLKLKSGQFGAQNDFSDVDVRRLHGILHDFKSISEEAIQKMDELLGSGNANISFQEVQKLLSYELSRLGIS